MKLVRLLVLCMMTMLLSTEAFAHKPSDSYMRLTVTDRTIQGEWDIALRDLEITVGLDDNHDGKITWDEVRTKRDAIETYAEQHFEFQAKNTPCPLQFNNLLIDAHSDGHYAVLRFTAACATTINTLTLHDNFLYDIDAQHKGLISITSGEYAQSTILSADKRGVKISTRAPSILAQLGAYIKQGMVHIWLGYDHLLFLIALLLPSAWVYRRNVLKKDMPFKTVFIDVFTYVSAFTLAHAVTLALALFNLIQVPVRLTESLIAFTIVVSCLNNLHPVLKQHLWLLTFGFGLIHGMGFATTLSELSLAPSARWVALLGFNLGVELGQLAVVAVLLPIFFSIRDHWAYRVVIIRGLSCVILALAAVWFIQRAFNTVLIASLLY